MSHQPLVVGPDPPPPCCTTTTTRDHFNNYFFFFNKLLSHLGDNHCCLQWRQLCVNNSWKEILLRLKKNSQKNWREKIQKRHLWRKVCYLGEDEVGLHVDHCGVRHLGVNVLITIIRTMIKIILIAFQTKGYKDDKLPLCPQSPPSLQLFAEIPATWQFFWIIRTYSSFYTNIILINLISRELRLIWYVKSWLTTSVGTTTTALHWNPPNGFIFRPRAVG